MQKDNQEGGSSPSRGVSSDAAGTSGGAGGAGGRGRGNAANLSHEARVKGGQRSAQVQVRDEHGQFAGRSDKSRSRDQGSAATHHGGEHAGKDEHAGIHKDEHAGNRKNEGGGESTPGRE